MRLKFLPLVFISMAAPLGAYAATDAPLRLVIGPHVVQEVRSQGSLSRLTLDGTTLVEEANSFEVKIRRSIDGVPVVVIYADTSGGSCMSGTSLFISGESRSVREVGTVGNGGCWTDPKYSVQSTDAGAEAIMVEEDPGVSYPGELWRFAPRTGLHKVADLTYAPEPGTTYQDLRVAAGHGQAIALFRNAAFSKDFDRLTGPAKAGILPAVGDADPNALIDGRYLTAEGWQPHDALHQTLIAVDLLDARIFVADHPSEGRIAVYPVVGQWPPPIRRKLAAWAKALAPAPVETAGRR